MEQGVAMNFSRRLIASEILAANRREQRFTKYGVGTPASGGVMDRMRQMGKPGPGLTYTVRSKVCDYAFTHSSFYRLLASLCHLLYYHYIT